MPDKYKGTWDAIKQIVSQEGSLSLYKVNCILQFVRYVLRILLCESTSIEFERIRGILVVWGVAASMFITFAIFVGPILNKSFLSDKGVMAPLATVVPIFSIGFVGYGFGKYIIANPNQETLTSSRILFAGLISGAATTVVTVPAERIKCLLQMQGNGSKKYNGFMDCGMKLWKEGGVRNLYVGTCATLLRDVPATGLYFCTYEEIMRFLTSESDRITWQPLLAGGCAGTLNWIVSMPIDTLKSKLQTSALGEYPRGLRSVYPLMVKKDGFGVLYRGIIPVLIRAFPANAACLWGYEISMALLDKHVPWL